MNPLRIPALGLAGLLLTACFPDKPPLPEDVDGFNAQAASEVYVRKGVSYMEAGNLEIALNDLKRAIDLDKRNSEAHNALAVLYQRLDNPTEAEASFKRAVTAKADNFSVRNNFGRFLCARGRVEEAMTQFRVAYESKLYETPWFPLTNAGVCAASAGNMPEAEDYLRRAIDLNPAFPPALLELAKVSRERGQHLSARGFLQRYQSVGTATAESLWLATQTELALENPDGARDFARQLRAQFAGTKEAAQAQRIFGSN